MEVIIEEGDPAWRWPTFDERQAAIICHTSGTTGDPKGVVYSHRAIVLQTLYGASVPYMPGTEHGKPQTLLSLAPMFHGNAWNYPFVGPLIGAKLVFPGRSFEPARIYDLIRDEKVTRAAGVPSIWVMLADWAKAEGKSLAPLKQAFGEGSTVPPSMIRRLMDEQGLEVTQSWGMTEALLATTNTLKPGHGDLPTAEQFAWRSKSGRAAFGVKLRIVDDHEVELPRDGESVGHLRIKGPTIAAGYLNRPDSGALDAEGWLVTGDLATLDEHGYLTIVDRLKDVIRSGGEWISSLALERAALNHPAVAQAAVIGVPHAKWVERPLLLVVLRPGMAVTPAQLTEHLRPQVARWWLPDGVEIVDGLPMSATGKVNKRGLREKYQSYPATPCASKP